MKDIHNMVSVYGQCQSESFVGGLLDINGSHTLHIGVQHQAHQPQTLHILSHVHNRM